MKSAAYRKQLAKQIDGALVAAEKHAAKEGFALYAFLFGYIVGDCRQEEIDSFDARCDRLQQKAKP